MFSWHGPDLFIGSFVIELITLSLMFFVYKGFKPRRRKPCYVHMGYIYIYPGNLF